MASTTPSWKIALATDSYGDKFERFNVRVMQGPISETVLYEVIAILAVLLVAALIGIGVLVYWAFFRKSNGPQLYQAVRMTEVVNREVLNQ